MYTCYQNLWTTFVANNNIENKYDIALVRFFQNIQGRYSPNTLWVIYSCLNSRFIDNYRVNLKSLHRLHKYLKQQTQLYVATKSKTFSTKEIDTILMYLQDKKEPKETLQGVAIALLYFGLLRSTEVQMIQMDDVKVEDLGSKKVIEVTFKHERKQRNEGFQYYIPSKFFPMFGRYSEEICKDTVASGNLQFLKNWNKIGRRRVQNTGKNNINILHIAACKILKRNKKGYSSHCWRHSTATKLADTGEYHINLKQHGQWVSNGMVEGYIANSLPLHK